MSGRSSESSSASPGRPEVRRHGFLRGGGRSPQAPSPNPAGGGSELLPSVWSLRLCPGRCPQRAPGPAVPSRFCLCRRTRALSWGPVPAQRGGWARSGGSFQLQRSQVSDPRGLTDATQLNATVAERLRAGAPVRLEAEGPRPMAISNVALFPRRCWGRAETLRLPAAIHTDGLADSRSGNTWAGEGRSGPTLGGRGQPSEGQRGELASSTASWLGRDRTEPRERSLESTSQPLPGLGHYFTAEPLLVRAAAPASSAAPRGRTPEGHSGRPSLQCLRSSSSGPSWVLASAGPWFRPVDESPATQEQLARCSVSSGPCQGRQHSRREHSQPRRDSGVAHEQRIAGRSSGTCGLDCRLWVGLTGESSGGAGVSSSSARTCVSGGGRGRHWTCGDLGVLWLDWGRLPPFLLIDVRVQ